MNRLGHKAALDDPGEHAAHQRRLAGPRSAFDQIGPPAAAGVVQVVEVADEAAGRVGAHEKADGCLRFHHDCPRFSAGRERLRTFLLQRVDCRRRSNAGRAHGRRTMRPEAVALRARPSGIPFTVTGYSAKEILVRFSALSWVSAGIIPASPQKSNFKKESVAVFSGRRHIIHAGAAILFSHRPLAAGDKLHNVYLIGIQ